MLLQVFFQANTLTSLVGEKDVNTTGSNQQLSRSPLTDDCLKARLCNYAFRVPVSEPQEKSAKQVDIVYQEKKSPFILRLYHPYCQKDM